MSVNIQVSEVIQRPVQTVFNFYAVDHVRNHPRWDPAMELWLDDDGPIGTGTVIHRRNSRSGNPIEGTMEIIEFIPEKTMAAVIHDGPLEIHGRADFEPIDAGSTKLSLTVDVPEMDSSMQEPLKESINRSIHTIKSLIESET